MLYSHINSLWYDLLDQLIGKPIIGSRDGECHEVIGYSAQLENINGTWLCDQRRALSPAYAAAEFLWYMSRQAETSMLEAYAPSYKKFAERDGKAHGAYGSRLLVHAGFDQLTTIVKELNIRPESRQAIAAIWWTSDLKVLGQKKDMPCTLTWQFLVRDDKLHMVTNMRSNDVWLGLPYDIFCFTCVQRMMAGTLMLEPGSYTHNVGSMHLYERNFQAAKEVFTNLTAECGLPHAWEVPDTIDTVQDAIYAEYCMRVNKTTPRYPTTTGHMCRDLLTAVYIDHFLSSANRFISPALNTGHIYHVDHRRNRLSRQDDTGQEASTPPSFE